MGILDKLKSKTSIDGIKKPKKVEAFIRGLSSYDDADRIEATLALGEMRDPKTIDPLIQDSS